MGKEPPRKAAKKPEKAAKGKKEGDDDPYECPGLVMLILAAVAWASFMIYMYAFVNEYVDADDSTWHYIGIGLAGLTIMLIEGALLFKPDIWWFFLLFFALWLTVAAIFGIMVETMVVLGVALALATMVLIAIHAWQVYK